MSGPVVAFRTSQVDGVDVFSVEGRLSLSDLDEFRSRLDAVLGLRDRPVVIDLTGCPFAVSRLFADLFRAASEMKEERQALPVVCPPHLLEVLRTLRLEDKLQTFSVLERALASLRDA